MEWSIIQGPNIKIEVNLEAAARHSGPEVLRSKPQNLSHLFIMAVRELGLIPWQVDWLLNRTKPNIDFRSSPNQRLEFLYTQSFSAQKSFSVVLYHSDKNYSENYLSNMALFKSSPAFSRYHNLTTSPRQL